MYLLWFLRFHEFPQKICSKIFIELVPICDCNTLFVKRLKVCKSLPEMFVYLELFIYMYFLTYSTKDEGTVF